MQLETLVAEPWPDWGLIDGPGLGVAVDEAKVMACHEDFRRHGEYPRTPPLADAR